MSTGPYRELAEIKPDDFPKPPSKEISTFIPGLKCIKCTSTNISLDYCMGWMAPESIKSWDLFKAGINGTHRGYKGNFNYQLEWDSLQPSCKIAGEHLHVRCNECNYIIDPMKCADAK